MNFDEKTDRQLLEEIILQNITIYKRTEDTRKKVQFIFVITILSIIGTVLAVLNSFFSTHH